MKIILILFLLAGSANAADIFVDKDVACNGSGTTGSPYCSIALAVSAANAGDTIKIRDAATPYTEQIETSKSGASGNPIIVQPDTGHNPTLRNAGAGATCATFWLHGSYWTFQNLNFDATGVNPCAQGAILAHATIGDMVEINVLNSTFKGWGGPTGEPSALQMTALQYSGGALGPETGFWPSGLIEGNVFDANRLITLSLLHTQNVTVRNNEFKNPTCGRDGDGAVNEVGIKANYNNKLLTIVDNEFHDWAPHANCTLPNQAFATWSAYWCDVGGTSTTIERNKIWNIDPTKSGFGNPLGLGHVATGIFVEHSCYGHTVKNNIVYDVGSVALRNRQDSHDAGNMNKYYNNTVYSNQIGMYIVNPAGVEIKNNIFFDNSLAQIELDNNTVGNNAINNNLYFDTAGGNKVGQVNFGSVQNFATWKATCSCDANSVNADPLLTNTAGADFTLQSASPAKNAGSTAPGVTNDYAGRLRDSAPDIGAYEFVIGQPGARLRGTVVQ